MINENTQYVFVTTDHLGRKVVLEKKTFYGHIVPGHPEMAGNELAIQESVEKPLFVIESKQNSNVFLYVTQSQKSTYPNLYIKTVVDHSTNVGFVKTSFFQKNLQPGKEGKVIFP